MRRPIAVPLLRGKFARRHRRRPPAPFIGRPAAFKITTQQKRQRAVPIGIRIIAIACNRRIESGQRFFGSAEIAQGNSQIGARADVSGVQRGGTAECRHGIFQRPDFAQTVTDIEMHFNGARINRQRAAEMNQRGCGPAQFLQSQTLVGMGGDIFRARPPERRRRSAHCRD